MDKSEIDELLEECDVLPDRFERTGDNHAFAQVDVFGETIASESIFTLGER